MTFICIYIFRRWILIVSCWQPFVGRELFAAGFVSCWAQLNETSQKQLVRSLEMAFSSPNIPPEILATLLNLVCFWSIIYCSIHAARLCWYKCFIYLMILVDTVLQCANLWSTDMWGKEWNLHQIRIWYRFVQICIRYVSYTCFDEFFRQKNEYADYIF